MYSPAPPSPTGMPLKNTAGEAGDLAASLAGKAEDALEGAGDKVARLVPESLKAKAEDLADKAVDKAAELIGKAADKLEGK